MDDRKAATRLELEVFEMESLNIETLNIEELERRLELTSGLMTAMEWGCGELGCTVLCSCDGDGACPTLDPICATYLDPGCPTYCVDAPCATYGIDCPDNILILP